jgi:hypothetical protein
MIDGGSDTNSFDPSTASDGVTQGTSDNDVENNTPSRDNYWRRRCIASQQKSKDRINELSAKLTTYRTRMRILKEKHEERIRKLKAQNQQMLLERNNRQPPTVFETLLT